MRRLLSRGVHAATLRLALGGLALASGACAVASKDAASPTAGAPAMEAAPAAAVGPPTPSPGDDFAFGPDEGLDPAATLARAEADLDAALGGPRSFATPPQQPPKRSPEPKGAEAPKESPLAATDACTTACRALASMRRSADRICDLTTAGAEPARCDDARTRVTRAVERVRERCPSCTSEG